jgi:thioredoxin reductase (NADPH)
MYDLVIIGAGPAGLTAGVYAQTKRLSSVVLEANQPGGQLTCLYPFKSIHDFPSYTDIEAKELVAKMVAQAKEIGCDIREGEEVTDLKVEEEKVTLKTAKGTYEAKVVILAMGMGLFQPMKLGIPGEDRFEGKGVFYNCLDLGPFEGKKALCVGGGDSALEMALTICGCTAQTTLIHRKDTFRADEMTVERVSKSPIKVVFRNELKEVIGKDKVEAVRLINNETQEERVEPMDAVLINIGFSPNLESVERWGLKLEGKAVTVDTEMRTNLKGVFACGDLVTYPGKTKRITTACGEATTAVNSAYKYIRKPYWA